MVFDEVIFDEVIESILIQNDRKSFLFFFHFSDKCLQYPKKLKIMFFTFQTNALVLDFARRQRSWGRGPLPGRQPPEQERERQRSRWPLQA